MLELFNESILMANLPYTILLILILVYWVFAIVTGIDSSSLDLDLDLDMDMDVDIDVDVDVDIDADVDIDVDADADMDADTEMSSMWLLKTLAFFNLGKIPFMLYISLLFLCLWVGSLLGNFYIGKGISWFPWIWIIPNLLIGLFVTKYISMPLGKLFGKLGSEGRSRTDLAGKICTVTLNVSHHRLGQVELKTEDDILLLNAKAIEGQNLPKGSKAIVLEYDQENDFYLVESFNH